MHEMLRTAKRVIIFMVLAVIIPWLTVAAFLAFLPWQDPEVVSWFQDADAATVLWRLRTLGLIAFIITYILAKHLINKKTANKLWRLSLYIIIDIALFIILLFAL